jgi:hypothetical protein
MSNDRGTMAAHIAPLYLALAESGKIIRHTCATLRKQKFTKNCYATAQKMADSLIFLGELPAAPF